MNSALLGLVFGALNFWFLIRIVTGLVRSDHISKWKTAFFFFGKMTIFFGIIGLILWKAYVSPLPFLGGFSVSLVTGILILLLKSKPKD